MNWLDVVLLVIIGYTTVRSLARGFTREIVGLASSLLALVLGMWFYGYAGSFVAPYVASPRIANLLGFLMVVFAVLIAGSSAAWIIGRFLATVGLSVVDRLLGAAFGLMKGTLICIALLTAFLAFGPHAESGAAPEAVLHSQIAPYVLEASHFFVAVAPMDLKKTFQIYYAQVQAALLKSAPARETRSSSKPQ